MLPSYFEFDAVCAKCRSGDYGLRFCFLSAWSAWGCALWARLAEAGPFYVATGEEVLVIEAHGERFESFIEIVADVRVVEINSRCTSNGRRKEVEASRLASLTAR
jgi:hypothetical protein